jgi:hypothetical protein
MEDGVEGAEQQGEQSTDTDHASDDEPLAAKLRRGGLGEPRGAIGCVWFEFLSKGDMERGGMQSMCVFVCVCV